MTVPLMLLVGALVTLQSRVNGSLAGQLGDGLRAGALAAVVSFGSGLLLLTLVVLSHPRRRAGLLRLRDALRVAKGELVTGLALGLVLGTLGLLRVTLSDVFFGGYGDHALRIGMAVGISLVGVVMFGTLAGSMLPLLLGRMGFDPASASAPFVATLVDVTGLVIYFSVASALLGGTLL